MSNGLLVTRESNQRESEQPRIGKIEEDAVVSWSVGCQWQRSEGQAKGGQVNGVQMTDPDLIKIWHLAAYPLNTQLSTLLRPYKDSR